MKKISIMQGRLSPPFEGRFQAFPAKSWEKEFYLAKSLGVYSIEWIFEKFYAMENPIASEQGINRLKDLIDDSGVSVKSICADYYMTELLIKNGHVIEKSWEHLLWLIKQAKKLNIIYVILPFVDASALKTVGCRNSLIFRLRKFLKEVEYLNIELHLEADMIPKDFLRIFMEVSHPLLKMNYDIGNSASLGYNPDDEFKLLGKYLGSVHIKDRVFRGSTVPLGTGDAEFKKCFHWFEYLNFNRWFVLQVARGKSGEEELTIRNQMKFLEDNLIPTLAEAIQ
jgi:hexulose-6-phosphate isomerase